MLGEDDGDAHKGQLPPFTPPKFHRGQDNLYKQFKSFKHVIEFAFRGQNEKCPNSVKCGSILNWLGIEAYPVYDNLPITEDNKKDPTKLLEAFEKYFKPECNIFQSWYALGSTYSSAYCHGLKIRVFYFLYISQILQMNQISFMVAQVNAVLLIHWFCMGDRVRH